tara:strand:- start:85 stop:522 length:438 start_codon:yes stop_codon:yes gene_type:complete
MNEDLLGKCRACGQIVSKNLVNGCPHCGEADPHLTEEESENLDNYQEQEREKEERKENAKQFGERSRISFEKRFKRPFKRLAILAMPVWFIVFGGLYKDNGALENGEDLFFFLATFCFVNPLTLYYIAFDFVASIIGKINELRKL